MSSQARSAADRLLSAPQPEIDDLCRRSEVALLVLFGSAVDPDSDPGDVDLAVLPLDGFHALAFLDELYRYTGFEGFDLLDLSRADPLARERALVGVRLLHERSAGLFATTQIAAIMERMDTDEMRRVQLELMAR